MFLKSCNNNEKVTINKMKIKRLFLQSFLYVKIKNFNIFYSLFVFYLSNMMCIIFVC